MCCGRKSSRPRRGRSGKITKGKKIQALSNDNIEHPERLQPPSDEQLQNSSGTIQPPEISGSELLP